MAYFEHLLSEIPENITCAHKTGYIGVTEDYHKHANYEIYLLLNGETNYFFGQEGFHMTRGKGVFIKSDVFHRIEYLNPDIYERITIHIKEDFFSSLSSSQTNLGKMLQSTEHGNYIIFDMPEEMMEDFIKKSHVLEKALRYEQYGDDLLSTSVLCDLLIQLNRLVLDGYQSTAPDAFMPPLITELIAYIHENPKRDLSVETIANVFHHNGHYISRRFKEAMGISLQQYIIYTRLDTAKHYIAAGYPLMQVCFLSGFHDYSNFAKTFSKYLGISPKKYQKQVLK